jgi:hypothetical protein
MRLSLTRSSVRLVPSLAALGFVLAGAPRSAEACGGFFCSSTPVDQTAEHILFTVNGDHTVTQYVQIQYAGDPQAFAWIIPSPSTPKLDASFSNLAMQALDNATQPQYRTNACYPPEVAFAGAPSGATDKGSGVTVIARQDVGPYDTVTLTGTDASVIVDWLQQNGFRITDKMTPFIEPYVEGGMQFVAMRLLPDKGTSDITPLVMTYDSDTPMIPLRLTTVAAQPEMGIVVWILADRRYGPENYVNLQIPDSLIKFDQYGFTNNYLTLVSELADKVGGQAFVTEYAKVTSDLVTQMQQQTSPTPEGQQAQADLVSLLGRFRYITRLYTRMSAEEMTLDPTFAVSAEQADVSNIHDLSDPNSPTNCTPPPPPDPCAFAYCGRRGACGEPAASTMPGMPGTATNAVPSCLCAGDATARATTTGNGQAAVYCEPMRMNFDDPTSGSSIVQAACEGFDCGAHGECVGMNGNPTCRCEPGYGAVVSTTYDPQTGSPKYGLSCEFVTNAPLALPRLPPVGQTTIPGGASSDASGGCSTAPGRSADTDASAVLVALSALLGFRRRRTASSRPS